MNERAEIEVGFILVGLVISKNCVRCSSECKSAKVLPSGKMRLSCTCWNNSPNCSDGGTCNLQGGVCADATPWMKAAPRITKATKLPDRSARRRSCKKFANNARARSAGHGSASRERLRDIQVKDPRPRLQKSAKASTAPHDLGARCANAQNFCTLFVRRATYSSPGSPDAPERMQATPGLESGQGHSDPSGLCGA